MTSSFLISAPASGSGKTTVARGLMALLVKKGMKVQPFKCGPDYIDTKFHEAVCGRPSINLDTFMATKEHVKELFAEYGKDADVWDWFDANCYKYGFINRYPESKQDVTGVSNDFHHYRYVGKEAAKMMYDSNQCLEEFLGK